MKGARGIRRSQSGFSLIELLVVIAVLSATAYIALDAVDRDTSQIRYDMTEKRLQSIRSAVVGEQGLSANGAPIVAGFVADVGQLPPCLRALIEPNTDCDQDGTADFTPPAFGAAGPLSFGWRGPYLSENSVTLRDAWGNSGDAFDGIAPETEFGWEVSAAATSFDVSSLGRDRTAGGAEFYDVDHAMRSISVSDFQLGLTAATITIDLTDVSGAARNVCLGVQVPDPTDETTWDLIESSAGVIAVPANGTVSTTLTSLGTVTHGVRPVLVYDEDDTSVTGCSIGAGQEANFLTNAILASRNFLFVPRTTPAASMAFTLP
ncbi:MAG: prepilin-type N-terminal cleavage/methylation domain-containing protein [Pseudomonadota bacterium]